MTFDFTRVSAAIQTLQDLQTALQTDDASVAQTLANLSAQGQADAATIAGLNQNIATLNALVAAQAAQIAAATVVVTPPAIIPPPTTSASFGRVFFDDFEGDLSKWQSDGTRNRPQLVPTALDGGPAPFSGTKMLQCNYDGTKPSADPTYYETLRLSLNYTDELFLRARIRVGKDHIGVAQKVFRFFETPTGKYHDFFMVVGHPQAALNSAGNTTTQTLQTYWGGAAGDTSNDPASWHTVSLYLQQSTGTVSEWHDQIQVRHNTGLNFDGLKWTEFYLTSNGDTVGPPGHTYFDSFEVYSDLGTGGMGKMSDATAQ